MNHYPEGSLVQFQNIFRDVNGFPIDPAVVTCAIQVGSGPPGATLTYASATSPSVGAIARVGLGRYATWGDSTGVKDEEMAAKWVAPPGIGQAAEWDTVFIEAAPF